MDLAALRDQIEKSFKMNELETLCFDLGINFENLPGVTLEDKSRELVDYCRRTNRISDLVNLCRKLRPAVDWVEITVESAASAQETFGGGNYVSHPGLPGETAQRTNYINIMYHEGKQIPGFAILSDSRFLLLPLKKEFDQISTYEFPRAIYLNEIQNIDLPGRGSPGPWFTMITNSGTRIQFSLSTSWIPGLSFSDALKAWLAGIVSRLNGFSRLARDFESLGLVNRSGE